MALKIELEYSSSEGPHLISLKLADIQAMAVSGNLTVVHTFRNGNTKTISITGSDDERRAFAEALLASVVR